MSSSKWEMVRLGGIAELITKGTTPTTIGFDFISSGVAFVKIENISDNGILKKEKFQFINNACHEKMKRSQLRENDILFSIAGALGRIAIVKKDILPANINQALSMIRIKDPNIDLKYVVSALKSQNINAQFQKQKQGVAQLNLSLKNISDLEIPLPPLEIQKQIAKTLNTVCELLDMRKKQLSELDTLIRSVFYDMFGDPVVNEMGWEVRKLCEIGGLNRGLSKHRPRNAPELLGGPYPLIQTGDVASAGMYLGTYKQTYSEIGLKQSKMWKKGTLCITIAANIAKTAILKIDACFPDSIVGFVSSENSNTIYIHHWFGFFQKILEEQAPESAQKNINLRILNELKIIMPNMALQNKFATIVEKIEEQKETVQKSIDETQYLFDSLMAEYFG